jgi:hypothetical protein
VSVGNDGTVLVRVLVRVTPDGEYAAYGYDGADREDIEAVLDDMRGFEGRLHWLTIRLPVPAKVEAEWTPYAQPAGPEDEV